MKKNGLDALVEVRITRADYQKICHEKLKQETKNVSVRGFRKGKVPFSHLDKHFGPSVRAREVSRLAAQSLSDFFKKENLSLVGDPILLPRLLGVPNWHVAGDYAFAYRIGLLGAVPLHLLNKKTKLKKHVVTLSASFLEKKAEALRSLYKKEIPLDQLQEQLKAYYEGLAEDHLTQTMYKKAIQLLSFALPGAYVQERIATTLQEDDQKPSDEEVKKATEQYREALWWSGIRQSVVKEAAIEIDEETIRQKIRQRVKAQTGSTEQEEVEIMVGKVLQAENGQYGHRVYEEILNERVLGWMKEKVTIKECEVSAEAFEALRQNTSES